MNRFDELLNAGQSVWFDNISRSMIASGELDRMIAEDGLRGVTSNPTIFHKSITSGTDYDESIRELRSRGAATPAGIFNWLATADIAAASERFQRLYQETNGRDGYVSIEVSPHLAHETAKTITEAQRLFSEIGRRNVMIKVPATKEGLPAVEHLIAEGLNVNVTLLFAIERYEEVAHAYIRGLEKRAQQGKPLDSVASVASFFVSRVDTQIDKQLEDRMAKAGDPQQADALRNLLGKAGVANAKLAYQKYKEIFRGPEFTRLKGEGARPQRVLWASTSTKNPAYSDLLYVDELIGPNTVNTMPPATYEAFKHHGKVRPSLESDLDAARSLLHDLSQAAISLREVTSFLEEDGVKRFADSYDAILAALKQ